MQPYIVNENGNVLTAGEAKNYGLIGAAAKLVIFTVKVATIPVWVPFKAAKAIANSKSEKEEVVTWD